MKANGISRLAGIDEAGRGALAGPLVVAAVVLDYQKPIAGLNDSKQLTASVREQLFHAILNSALAIQIVESSAAEVDKVNIRQASILGFEFAFLGLEPAAEFALIDGKDLPVGLQRQADAVIKGDSLYACIAAASILAKVHRDNLMRKLDLLYPEYGFATHKGYGTVRHYAALASFGACAEHRKTFRLF